jgi:hypothetical protein
LDIDDVQDTAHVGAAPVSSLIDTPLIEFSPPDLSVKEPFVPAEYEIKEEPLPTSGNVKNSPTNSDENVVTTIPESRLSGESISSAPVGAAHIIDDSDSAK